MFWSLVRPDRLLPPITRSAAVATSLEADELAVGMITYEMFKEQTPGVRRLVNAGVDPFRTPTINAPAAAPSPRSQSLPGGSRKFFERPSAGRSRARSSQQTTYSNKS